MSSLVNKNIRVGGHRTSIRFEPSFWEALDEIALERHVTVDDIVAEVCLMSGDRKGSLTSAIRVFILEHYRHKAPASERIL
jgi:predicted DNA-binding ribbon-helix-helix protein